MIAGRMAERVDESCLNGSMIADRMAEQVDDSWQDG